MFFGCINGHMYLCLWTTCIFDMIWMLTSTDSGQCFLSCPALACPLLRSAARHRVAPVECDDHGLDKAPHSWPLVPLWKFATGSLDHRVGGGQSPSTPRLSCQTRVAHPCTTTWLPAATSATHLYRLHFTFFMTLIHVGGHAGAIECFLLMFHRVTIKSSFVCSSCVCSADW